MAVGQLHRRRFGIFQGRIQTVEIDIIVADAVHLIKFAKHFYNSSLRAPIGYGKRNAFLPAILCPFRESD